MPPMALPSSSYANPLSSSTLNPQSYSTGNPPSLPTSGRQSSSIFLNLLWSLPPVSWGLSVLALGILVVIFLHRLTSRSPLRHSRKPRQANPSADVQHLLAPYAAKPLQSIPSLPPPLPIPTIRRHSYPLTINSNINSSNVVLSSSPSSSPSVLARDPSSKARQCSGSRRHTDVIRQNTTEDVNGCRRHVMVFQKPG